MYVKYYKCPHVDSDDLFIGGAIYIDVFKSCNA